MSRKTAPKLQITSCPVKTYDQAADGTLVEVEFHGGVGDVADFIDHEEDGDVCAYFPKTNTVSSVSADNFAWVV